MHGSRRDALQCAPSPVPRLNPTRWPPCQGSKHLEWSVLQLQGTPYFRRVAVHATQFFLTPKGLWLKVNEGTRTQ